MKRRVLDYIVCPHCKGRLQLETADTAEEVTTGTLACSCGRSYPLRGGIPRLLPDHLSQDKLRTADAFGWEWQEFDALHASAETYHEQFLDWISPIEPGFFKDKVVLDAGCGMGRFSIASADFGAKDVIAIDLSGAVEAAYRNAIDRPNVHVIQADIYNLPFAQPFDFAFSIGVLHHLPDPESGFHAIVQHIKPEGSIFAWVYGREQNGWLVHIVNPLREKLSSRLPRRALYGISFLLTLGAQPVLKLLYLPANSLPRLRWLARLLPYNGYLSWLAKFGFRHNHHVIFDHLVAPTAFYISQEEFRSWFRRAELAEPRLSWRNQNSWRGWASLHHANPRP